MTFIIRRFLSSKREDIETKSSHDNRRHQLDDFLCGAGAGGVARMIVAPFDLIKIRFQLQSEPTSSFFRSSSITSKPLSLTSSKVPLSSIKNHRSSEGGYRGVSHAFGTIIKEEGILSLWKGNIPALLMVIPFASVQFGAYSIVKNWMLSDLSEEEIQTKSIRLSASQSLIAGSISGISATLTTYPLDFLRSRLASQGEPKVHPSLRSLVKHTYESSGLIGFYRGLSPTIVQIIPYVALQFMTFNVISTNILHSTTHSHIGNLLAGTASGIISKAIVIPMDVVKRRMQLNGFNRSGLFTPNPFYSSSWNCALTIYRTEGLHGLYKGTVPSILKAGPSAAINFAMFHFFKNLIYELRHKQI